MTFGFPIEKDARGRQIRGAAAFRALDEI